MYLILVIGFLLKIATAKFNCTAVQLDGCEQNNECQIINQQCTQRWKDCYKIQQPSVERCQKFNCDYDQMLDYCISQTKQSILESKIYEILRSMSSNQKNCHKKKKYDNTHVKESRDENNNKEIYSSLEIDNIKQKISQINKTQFQQLNFIISFAATLSFSSIILNLILLQ